MGSLITTAAAIIAIIAYVDATYPEMGLREEISSSIARLGELWGLLPPVSYGPVRLGHAVVAVVAIILVFGLFYRPMSLKERMERARIERERRAEEARQRALKKLPIYRGVFKGEEVINAGIHDVWGALKATNCGPECSELLDYVEVVNEEPGVVYWVGKGDVAGKSFSLEGQTKLVEPAKLEILCYSGALQGFKGTYRLKRVRSGTKVVEKIEFDPNMIPPEFNVLIPKLAGVLKRSLRNMKNAVEERLLAKEEAGVLEDLRP